MSDTGLVDKGEGPNAILFLHGLFGAPEHWRVMMESLADRYRVIAPQLPIDPHPDRRKYGMKTIGDLTDMVSRMVNDLELDSFVICGNSLGGLVAIDYCLQHPDVANGLVLAGSAGLFERSPIKGLRLHPTKEFVRSTISGILHNESLLTEELVDQWHAALTNRDYLRFLLRASRATRDRCVENELAELDLPTMIVWGSDDEITPPSVAKEFHRRIAGSRLSLINECGHAPNWERPDKFAELLEEFLPSCFQTQCGTG
ncbi:2-hydroxy-6-oxo-6-phenylhexa-2,4-dienoate hydrolase [Rubripirellula obstinata]|uniref:2-hydroxy-6-oxo-6-phenylhexa-2,4-dienoate hydrolase n=2 Tax=Rubripirellula obstinata TaxID=406547 RepID=A0A5B1CE41_9BACT|nr:2-hydroxy-6-oxo-6-phenylhexa-2,4-dienoate hydrolase [Rubripirellula obstinata]